jgi:thymidylate synthase
METRHPEYQYLDLLKEVLESGVWNTDRGTGVRSLSVFGRQTRYDLSKGFPLLTTKKVYWKGVLHELFWFMSGQSNIKYLVDNNVHIWDDYPYKIYKKEVEKDSLPDISPEEFVERIKNDSEFAARAYLKAIKKVGLTDLTQQEFIERIKNDNSFAEKWGDLPKIYGELWRRWPTRTGRTIDQLKWVIDELTEDPFARNAIVNSWNPEYLYTMATHEDASRFPICHNMYQVSIKDGKLYLQLYQRSADLFLGVPFNIASYALLAVILAQVLGVKPGEFIHTFGDAHIYENHLEQVKEQLQREPKPFPTLQIDPSIKDIDQLKPEHIQLEGYDPHPGLKGELTVAGGLFEKDQQIQKQ